MIFAGIHQTKDYCLSIADLRPAAGGWKFEVKPPATILNI